MKKTLNFFHTELGCFRDNGVRDLVGQWTNGAEINNKVCGYRCAKQVRTYTAYMYRCAKQVRTYTAYM